MPLTAYRATLEERHLARLLELVSAIRWPLAVPTPAQIHAAPPPLQGAWDAVAEGPDDMDVPELLEAHARAGRLGLDWDSPVGRAVAERATDEARVAGLLAGEAPKRVTIPAVVTAMRIAREEIRELRQRTDRRPKAGGGQ